VALTLPWFESLAPRALRAEQGELRRRFLPIFLPNGAAKYWWPATGGSGDGWQLSPILEPFGAALKSKLSVVSNLENASVFDQVEATHGLLSGAWLTCVDSVVARRELGRGEANGISVDQVLAQHPAFQGKTALSSLQVGLSTPFSSCDNQPCSNSRSVSWASPTQPLYKLVDPQEVFDRIVGSAPAADPSGSAAVEAERRAKLNKSVLDAVLENAQRTRARLGTDDQKRMDEFLTSVRKVEQDVTVVSRGMGGLACRTSEKYQLSEKVVQSDAGARQNSDLYNKGLHADAMNALIAMAFECDATRVISYMLEDERSEFVYDHVKLRRFSSDGTADPIGTCPEYHTSQHDGVDDAFATITWWNVSKVAELCRKLDSIPEAPGVSVLDTCVVMLGACMHGSDHLPSDLPVALVGGGKIGLKNDQHVQLGARPLRDLYFTLMNDVYGLGVSEFGRHVEGAPLSRISELLDT
jgi:hypothetical protein